MNRIRVKICGITSVSDAMAAAELGADALGFVFHRASPRFLEPARAREIVRSIPPFVRRVGVFVGMTHAEAAEIGAAAGVDLLQIHAPLPGPVPPAWADRLLPVFSPALIPEEKLVETIRSSRASCFLLDNAASDGAGGTGKPVDWTLAAGAARAGRMVLAGGLTPENVALAITATNPYAVDVSSGVERRPGVKDPALLEDFFAAVRLAGGNATGTRGLGR